MEDFMENFCQGEPIWDSNLAWNTTVPRFTRCFQKTIPVWIPALFLWLLAPLETYFTLKATENDAFSSTNNNNIGGKTAFLRTIPFNRYNVSRFVTIALILVVNGAQFGHDLWYFLWPDVFHFISMADLTSSLLNIFTFGLFAFLINLHRVNGIHTSGLAWFFTLVTIVAGLPIVYMFGMFYGNDDAPPSPDPYRIGFHKWHAIDLVLYVLHFGLLLVLFVLTCFADYRPPMSSRKRCSLTNADAFDINGSVRLISNNIKDDSMEMKGVVANGTVDAETPLMEEKRVSKDEDAHLMECPESRASFLSFITYWWFNALAMTGYKKSLTLEDLWRLNPEDSTNCIAPRFDRNWLNQINQVAPAITVGDENGGVKIVEPSRRTSTSGRKQPGTVTALFRTFGLYFIGGAMFKLGQDLLQFVSPQLLKIFIGFVSKPAAEEPIWHGFFIAVMFFLISMVQSVMINYYFHIMFSIGMRVRSALTSAIYRKSLNLSNGARRDTTTGEIVNLMSVDAQRFVDLLPFINLVWSAPLQILLTIYFLWIELGPSVLAGLGVMVLMIPLNGWISTYQRKLQVKQMKKKDERVKVVNEVLGGMRVIKLYGWEIPFISKVNAIRDTEIAQLQTISYIGAVTSFIWTCAPFLVSFVTFTIYVLISDENVLDAKKAFVSLALFNLLRFPLTMLPQMITSMVMASVSVKRLNKFLNSSQLEKYVTREESEVNAIEIDNGTFVWESEKSNNNKDDKKGTDKANGKGNDEKVITEETKMIDDAENGEVKRENGNGLNGNGGPTANGSKITLSGINLKVKKGNLVAIVGHVGSGKSSLLSAILGDMDRIEGGVNVAKSESVAYVAQQAWIRNCTLQDNVLFGSPLVKSRYDSIINMCALKPDIAILPGGDQTEIGEKGINLSGGQKQRVAIARACYSPASIVLFDDPLSAVDSHVAQHIFKEVISSKTGYLKDRTRVMVTNGISFLPEVDQIVVLGNGTISEIGTYQELVANNGKFSDFIKEHTNDEKKQEKEGDGEFDSSADLSSGSLRRRTTSTDSASKSQHNLSRQKSIKEEAEQQKLIEAEKAATGNVKMSVYMNYFRSLTYLWLSIMAFGFVGMQIAAVGSNVWLAIWSNDANRANNATNIAGTNSTGPSEEDISLRNTRLAVYGLLGLSQALFVLLGAVAMAKGTVNSSGTLHRSLLFRIMRSPMSFFDTTPLGRIVNRFSKDIDTVDAVIPHTIRGWLLCFLQVISTFILIGYEVPVFILVAFPILIIYYFIQKFYVATSRQLKRLESVTRSPIYSHFGETLSGVHTIRAYGSAKRFIADSNHIVDTNQRCYFPSFIANRWLALRLELCGNLIVFAAAVFAVLSRETLQPGFVGLVLTYALSVTQTLNWLVRMTSELETNVVSVERIGEYCENPTEKEWTRVVNAEPAIPENWPQKGEIKFVDYSVRYREGLSLVVSGINIEVKAGEKIGIVGRTGAGKSSLTLALFRILEAAEGSIVIDGIDISKIGLHELKSKLSIIPQDPVLFSGTIRSNLDPFAMYSDELLWQALEHSHLKDYIAAQDGGLDYPVAENGENLSVGQRQLICLGRALLRKTRILVLDEATAAIDLETDALIQQTIRTEFAQFTVLTIAHRLNTIMDSTRVLVLDKGKVAEFDSPANLLADRRSRFYALAKDARLV